MALLDTAEVGDIASVVVGEGLTTEMTSGAVVDTLEGLSSTLRSRERLGTRPYRTAGNAQSNNRYLLV